MFLIGLLVMSSYCSVLVISQISTDYFETSRVRFNGRDSHDVITTIMQITCANQMVDKNRNYKCIRKFL